MLKLVLPLIAFLVLSSCSQNKGGEDQSSVGKLLGSWELAHYSWRNEELGDSFLVISDSTATSYLYDKVFDCYERIEYTEFRANENSISFEDPSVGLQTIEYKYEEYDESVRTTSLTVWFPNNRPVPDQYKRSEKLKKSNVPICSELEEQKLIEIVFSMKYLENLYNYRFSNHLNLAIKFDVNGSQSTDKGDIVLGVYKNSKLFGDEQIRNYSKPVSFLSYFNSEKELTGEIPIYHYIGFSVGGIVLKAPYVHYKKLKNINNQTPFSVYGLLQQEHGGDIHVEKYPNNGGFSDGFDSSVVYDETYDVEGVPAYLLTSNIDIEQIEVKLHETRRSLLNHKYFPFR
ncbi:MAG: hypothetical protein OEZ47_17070 [Gammaproteobacteria bacterium]|nr:hypothetical protein [Gammaproteobacteria bacterium]